MAGGVEAGGPVDREVVVGDAADGSTSVPSATEVLERGRRAAAEQAWPDAFEALASVDRAQRLGAPDLQRLATAAYMLGRDDDYVAALERAHRASLDVGDPPRAARCAFWIGHHFLFRGETARATGWFARAQRLLDRAGPDCVERGYLLIPVWLAHMDRGDYRAGYATAVEAAEIGERFGDADLAWLARDDQARALLRQGRVADGLRLVDEALVVATAGDLSPVVTGIVYCNTIAFCRDAYELRHAREWTDALMGWCERQPGMVAHNGLCLVHRAELMLLRGTWEAALAEARRSAERFTRGLLNELACGRAWYCQGEAHRLRGEFAAAEAAYRAASRCGHEPQPGLALLRLAQGKGDAAAAAIRRVVGETTEPLDRAGLLPAYVEIMLAVGDLDRARAACRELDQLAERQGNEVLAAMAAEARGAVALPEGRVTDALRSLRRALAVWQELAAPYAAARVRVLLGRACRALGDDDTAALELDAARARFEHLGAAPDRDRVDALAAGSTPARPAAAHRLTERERTVLRLVAAGKSNREIASDLVISEHTVARHVQNIFAKLAVSSRTAAAAFAFAHDLL
jgi:DNA-binding NarL/FixJ family response regulator